MNDKYDDVYLYIINILLYIIIMKTIALAKDDFLAIPAGAKITFHRLAWEVGRKSISMNAGPDLRYHTLASDATALHTHEFAEFFLVISGKIKHIINSEVQILQTGTIVFVRPTDVHGFEKLEDSACELVNVAFKLEFLLDLSVYLGNDFFLRKYTGPVTSPMFKLSLPETEELALRMIRMNVLQNTSVDLARLKIKIMLAGIFTRFFLETDYPNFDYERPVWFNRLCRDMNKTENIVAGLQTLKRLAPCTQEHLCKCFRKYLDKTPTEFINELRIKQAAKQIVESDAKILAVAMDLGFKSLSRFYSMFNKFYGISPAKYRIMSRQNDIPI
ncbi:MAG TPA: hypothetical protein DHW42_06600 [Candidatus Marinimicrobia bacterium]|nr:hypothetical protein [Candidatus Neomarinimicrobiota bacterium]